ncbi:hypothetical protein TSAR_000143 [Trichomalopsis sarcophagae]|uniref:Uncharacterized protein n=1 Tax=Trichomalopsis sarcophagae TaxID=543379 RepID=A0A232FC92_9HYME|nr:hypothetical protein TSAR_000143 [Trichomalopsis sarcophagae]
MKKKALKKIAEDLECVEAGRKQMRRDWITMRKRIEEEVSIKWEIADDESKRNFVQSIIERVLETDARLMNFDKKLLSVQQEIGAHTAKE